MFLPTTRKELNQLGWDAPDIILVSGDSYIDSPFIGVAVIGKVLQNAGYRVAIIAQPDVASPEDITRLGEPRLFWGVTGGSVDSMVANTTASNRRRKQDDYTPGGENNRRPDRAVIAYSNLIKRHFKATRPIILGGIEASLRRVSHYDFWQNKIRRSILFDAKADALVYGMGETTILQIAHALAHQEPLDQIRGLCYISPAPVADYHLLPSHHQVAKDHQAFTDMFDTFYRNNDPLNAEGLCQLQDTRYLVQNPPAYHLTQTELDNVYALDFEYEQHPYYAQWGAVKLLETIRFSVSTHRGCYGECNFCAIAVHEGRAIRWRSPQSLESEVKKLTTLPGFKGIIHDISAPTANMYGFECKKKLTTGSCKDRRCISPEICPQMPITHAPQIDLLKRLAKVEGVRKVFVASGIRHDMVIKDKKHGSSYIRQIAQENTSGQLKLAPEHSANRVLKKMGKPGVESLLAFKEIFDRESRSADKKQFLTYYFIAAHPGCTEDDMQHLKRFASKELGIRPEQVQIFTPTPSTYASLMYWTGKDPFNNEPIYVARTINERVNQKQILSK
jgi:uncharacterized radical SAM protein YgiQ